MCRKNLAVPVKLWALFCTITGTSITADIILTFILVMTGFLYLAVQRNWKLLRSYAIFYLVLAVLMYLIRYRGLRMILFSEFYVLMFWNLSAVFLVGWDLITTPPGELSAFMSRIHMPTAVILGLLVMFRFFPTMKAELKSVWCSMRNRGLTSPIRFLFHPAATCEYVLVPMLLRCLQIADRLSVSAVARGADMPGSRSSYYGKRITGKDWGCVIMWGFIIVTFLCVGGVRA